MGGNPRTKASLFLALSITGCGGGSSLPTTLAATTTPHATSILAIGNSITRHPPEADIQWPGDWGMAASSMDKDYIHLVGASVGLPVTAQYHVDLERDPNAPIPSWPVDSSTIVVVMLGDNAMPPKYPQILAAVKGAAKVLCVSTYWGFADRDAQIKADCEAAGDTYVYVGDIYPNRKDDTSIWTNPAIQFHPYDWSMAQIAQRVEAAL